MEENKKLTYEQLEQVASTLQQRCIHAEGKLASLNMTTIRLDYLFKVLDRDKFFSREFINKITEEIESLLKIEDSAEENTEENK